ncbi:MAG: NAD(P)(+) transhydrogenase (Re/Si-specific) subunit beta [Saprospiraceae bacterium]|nr:NAD(P)(+) transhydrogenase (Re/Si-specific) subunit beta [Bacteroidia bacterium]NNK89740.1 NAD(P)(+) transhydrogenase (Re/Si-specific) subunit beta [Saprospiraceae bacterium]
MEFILEISYLIASITFILGLKMLSSPESARSGNLIAAAGMLIAIIATIVFHKDGAGHSIGNLGWIIAAMAVGTVIGWLMAVKVQMTAMPQMVSFFNGMGGACAALIALVEYNTHPSHEMGFLIVVCLSLIIGSVSFSGSMIAYGKLEGKIKDIFSNAMPIINGIIFLSIMGMMIYGLMNPVLFDGSLLWIILGVSLFYGIMFVMPIGGADMPVVISLLNSFTGVAAAFGGFMYDNAVMLTGGILVGSAGTILTILMCNAMNRSLMNVIIGSFGAAGAAKGSGEDKVAKEITLSDAAILCAYANKVSIVPGYGLAVAQAQHVCNDFEKLLSSKGVDVSYAIHPVAGRMPGHMNVLLAEADVSYDKLLELEDANDGITSTDVAIVVGANDVVNPAAEDDPSSTIYGMPIIQVHKAKNIIIMKRSMGKGYAGIANDLFFADNTRMLFGDAKDSLSSLVSELRSM